MCQFKKPSVLQVNGREVGQDARVMQEELQAASGSVVLKILPSYHEAIQPKQVTEWTHVVMEPDMRCLVILKWPHIILVK